MLYAMREIKASRRGFNCPWTTGFEMAEAGPLGEEDKRAIKTGEEEV